MASNLDELIAKLQQRTKNDEFKKSKKGKIIRQAEPMEADERQYKIFHDDIAARLSEGTSNINLYFKTERSLSSLEYYYDLNSPEIVPSIELSQTSADYTKIENAENDLVRKVKVSFHMNYIEKARAQEDASSALRAQVSSEFKDRKKVLQFYNNPITTETGQKINAIGIYQSVFNQLFVDDNALINADAKIQNGLINSNIDLIDKKLEIISKEIKSLLDDPKSGTDQFWILLSNFRLQISALAVELGKDGSLNKEDKRAFDTQIRNVTELFELAILLKKFTALKNDPASNIKRIYLKSTGSQKSEAFELFAEEQNKAVGKKGSKATQKIAKAWFEKKMKTDGLTVKGGNIGFYSSGGTDNIIDYEVVIELKSGEILTERVDAKFGTAKKYSSSSILQTFGQFIDDANNLLGSEIVKEFLQLILAFVLIDAVQGNFTKTREDLVFKTLKYFISYIGLLSKPFAEKFGLDKLLSGSPDHAQLVVVGGEYIWFSDFLKAFSIAYLDDKSAKDKGSWSIPRLGLLTKGTSMTKEAFKRKKGGSNISVTNKKITDVIPNFDALQALIEKDPNFQTLIRDTMFQQEINDAIEELRALATIFPVFLEEVFSKVIK